MTKLYRLEGNKMTKALVKTPIEKMKAIISTDSVREQFANALKENSGLFVASLIDIYGSDTYLQKCQPGAVVAEALKAATLQLPINKQLGFAYIVPYKNTPQFQIGYRGYLQLAQRTGAYRFINTDVVYEGEIKSHNKITGEIDLSGEPTGDKVAGYFAYIETVNGFKKTIYWTFEKLLAHAKRYSKSFNSKASAWQSNFDEMALKTMLRNLLSKYGVMSVEMSVALTADTGDDRTYEAQLTDDMTDNANQGVVIGADDPPVEIDPATGEVIPSNVGEDVPLKSVGPGF